MITNPKVSVIIPTYNDGDNLIKAIDSVFSQSCKDLEIIVVDDGSTDNTKDILKTYIENNQIIYLYENNLGVSIARNNGIKISKGEYIAMLDSDDTWIDKDKLKNQVDFLDKNNDYVLVGTGVVNFDNKGKEINRYLMPETDEEIRRKMLRINCFVNSSVLFKKVTFEAVHCMDSILEDYNLWLNFGIFGKFKNLPIYAIGYNVNYNGYGGSNKTERLKENLILSSRYRGNYPNYFKAFLLGHIKIYFYPIFELLPIKVKGILLKLHKKL